MARVWKLICFVLVLIAFLPISFPKRRLKAADKGRIAPLFKHQRYEYGEQIPLFVNKVYGTTDDRCDVFPNSFLPFCFLEGPVHKRKKSLNEILTGDCLTNTKYNLKFNVSVMGEFVCEKHMSEDDLTKFRFAIENEFEYQMYFDNIWFRNKLGEVVEETGSESKSEPRLYLFNYIEFHIDFMENQVVDINIVNDRKFSVDITNITGLEEVDFGYSVFWKDITLTNNWNHNISGDKATLWLTEEREGFLVSFSSFFIWTIIAFSWISLLLVAALPLLYFAKNSILSFSVFNSRQPHEAIRIRGSNDKTCYCPPFTSLLGATLGVGTQHLIIISLILVSAYEGVYPCNHEQIIVDLVVGYILMQILAGFIAISFHEKFSPIGWKTCMFQTGTLYFYPIFLSALVVNKPLTRVLPGYPIFTILAITGLISGVLMYLFISVRQYFKSEYAVAGCMTKNFVDASSSSSSTLSWYTKPVSQIILGGLIPFMIIFFNIEEIYATLWGMKVCVSLNILFITFLYAITTTFAIGIAFTGYQLLHNDYQWWWRSILRGGSPAIYMFFYGVYLISKLKSEKYMEVVPLLIYNGCICYSFFLVLGTVSFWASEYVFQCYSDALRKKRY